MTLEQYMVKVVKCLKENKEYRQGQAMFNVLEDKFPNLAQEIRGTNLDPFYDNRVIPDFLDFLIPRLELTP